MSDDDLPQVPLDESTVRKDLAIERMKQPPPIVAVAYRLAEPADHAWNPATGDQIWGPCDLRYVMYSNGLVEMTVRPILAPMVQADPEPEPSIARCPDCDVPPGCPHVDGCDVARCTACGKQRITCDHGGSDIGWGQTWTGEVAHETDPEREP